MHLPTLLTLAALLVARQPMPADEIELAGPELGAVRIPSAPGAWGGVRTGSEPTLSERIADYRIEATLDPVRHTVDGTERLTWRNRSSRAVRSLYFHLYLNAFESSGSTFMTELRRYGGFRSRVETKKGEWGFIELKSIRRRGEPLSWSYVHPDGGPDTDHTVVRVDLAEPAAPRSVVELDIEFHDQLPRVVARTGYFGDFHLVAQWYPKIGVLELPGERGATAPRWNCHEYHLFSEFYADFGAYDVSLTVPAGYVVGAVGEEQGPPQTKAQGLVHRFVQGDVHDFAFVASKDLQVAEGAYDGPGSPHVRVRALYPQEYAPAGRVVLASTLEALKYFSETLGPYPYRTVTAVVPPYNAFEAGGMEYETFFTSIGARKEPLLQFVRFVTVHEFGHGYFMGLLASNEFEEPFLDEGLNEFWDSRLLARAKVPIAIPALSRLGFPTLQVDWFEEERLSGTTRYPADPIAGNSWHRFSRQSYGLVYSRTATVFRDLEERLGGDVMARAFKEYYRRWHHRHPSTADLRQVLEEVSGTGETIDRWFDEQIYGASPVDDRIESLESEEILPQPGLVVRDGERVELDAKAIEKEIREKREAFRKAHPKRPKPGEPGPFPFRAVVQARRRAAQVPQNLVVKFEDGAIETIRWDAGERWHRWVFDRAVRVEWAQLDPERKILLDLNKLDDGKAREAKPLASRRWTLEAAAWGELLLSLLEAL